MKSPALLYGLHFMLESKVTVTEQNPASPILLKKQSSAVSDRDDSTGTTPPLPLSTHPVLWVSQPYPHSNPSSNRSPLQTQQESELLLAAKENISESHKRYFFPQD